MCARLSLLPRSRRARRRLWSQRPNRSVRAMAISSSRRNGTIEAGQCYAALASENRLPANRTNHWAYCRMVAVASRMNARPASPSDWDEIEAEILSIQRLAPKLWYGEYLRKYDWPRRERAPEESWGRATNSWFERRGPMRPRNRAGDSHGSSESLAASGRAC